MDMVYDVLVNNEYHSSMWNATPAQVRAYLFDLHDEIGADNIKVVQEDSEIVIDELKNYDGDNDNVEFDGNYVVGNKYPDYEEFYSFRDVDDDIEDIEWIDEPMDYEMADMLHDISVETRSYKTPFDYR